MRHWAESEPHMFAGSDLDEGLRGKVGAAVAAACIAGTPGCATTDAVKTVQTIGRTAQTFKGITADDSREELITAIKDRLRKGTGTRESRVAEASGYIPTAAEKNDPRYSMALTQDVHPGQTGREANKLGLKTDSQGRPELLMKKLENLLESVKTDEASNFVVGRPLKAPPSLRLMGEPIENEEEIRDVLERYLKISAPDATEAMKRAIDMMVDRPQSRMAYTVLGDLDLILRKFRVPIGSYYRARLDHALYGPTPRRVTEDEDLFEVKMSPGELQKWAQSEEAQGIRAGFEAELIFRDTGREEEYESEPDYDQDERARSIDDVIDFFQGGENGMGRNAANRLSNELYEALYEWQSEGFYGNVWNERYYTEWVDDNIWPDEQDEWRDRAQAELGLEDKAELTPEENDQIEQTAQQMFREESDSQWEDQGPWYSRAEEDAFDQYREENDDSEWLDQNLPYMSDVANEYNIDWPYWTEGGGREGGGRDAEEIAGSLSAALGGARVRSSTGYHNIRRAPDLWIIEPDGSLEPDDSEDTGLEIVSPPMPLPEALEKLRTVIDWANGDGDAYTNESTGLHMGISLPHKGGDVDYVKLILFMGDRYVLDEFGRAANTYAASALKKLQDVQRARRQGVREQATEMRGADKTAAAMDLMRKNLIELAAQYVQDGVGTSKYTSAHIKPGYIEFRSPGGDYLSMDDRDESALTNTMLRFARSMYLAGRPDLERKEYAKKLYQLIDTQGNDGLKLFMDYTTGKITPEELKKDWARQVLAKEQPAKPQEQEYEVYNKDTGEVLSNFLAHDDADAVELTQRRWSGKNINFGVRKKAAEPEKKLSRRAEIAKKLAARPTLWRVKVFDREQLVMAPDAEQAKNRARERDDYFNNNRTYIDVRPANQEEQAQYRVQQADNTTDSQQIQQRVAPDMRFPYRVAWREIQGGREIEDSLNLDAASADAAVDGVRRSLEVSGRRVVPGSLQARPRQEAGYEPGLSRQDQSPGDRREYHIYQRNNDVAIIGFMAASDQEALARLERFRLEHPDADVGVRRADVSMQTQAPAQQSGEWTGHWIVRDENGRELTRFHGIGNSQADANRHALRWLIQNGYGHGTEIEVVPEMR